MFLIILNSLYAIILSKYSPDFDTYVQRYNSIDTLGWRDLNWNDYYFVKAIDYFFHFSNSSISRIYTYLIFLTAAKIIILFYTFRLISVKFQIVFFISLTLFLSIPKFYLIIFSIHPLGMAMVCAFSCIILLTNYIFDVDFEVNYFYFSFLLTFIFLSRIDILFFMEISLIMVIIYIYFFIPRQNLKLLIPLILNTFYILISYILLNTSRGFIENGVKGRISISDKTEVDRGIIIVKEFIPGENLIPQTSQTILKSFFQLSGLIDQFFIGNTSGMLPRFFTSAFLISAFLSILFLIIKNIKTLNLNLENKLFFLIFWLLISYFFINLATREISLKVNYLLPYLFLFIMLFVIYSYSISIKVLKFATNFFLLCNTFNILFVSLFNIEYKDFLNLYFILNIILIIFFLITYLNFFKKLRALVLSSIT
jgi:hypothetical protein